MKSYYDVIIIGGGAVGLSTAYQLLLAYPDCKLAVLEKEWEVGLHQTGNNSGVIHSGIYYAPGSYKAQNCLSGRLELLDFARSYDVPYDVCGKIIVATQESELARLEGIYQRGLENGLYDIRKIDAQEIREIEPYCVGIAGIFVPYTGIIHFSELCLQLKNIINSSLFGKVMNREEALSIRDVRACYEIKTNNDVYRSRYLITCGGLQSDRLAKMEGLPLNMQILPFRGDYYELTEQAKHKVRNLIYPVPNPEFPFLGVHLTRMIQDGIECGPNAVFAFEREGYNKTDFNLLDTLEAFGFKGTWKFLRKHWRTGIAEQHRAFSKALFLKSLQRLIPDLGLPDLRPARSGVRAMALDDNGKMIDDFSFACHSRSIHTLNAPSPAATACLAIGKEVVNLAVKQFTL